MVKVKEHIDKIVETKINIKNSKGQQRKQFIRHLHKLQKQLKECKIYLKEGGKVI